VLGLQAQAFQIPMAAAPVRLPEILSREEISRLLAAARSPAAHAFLALAYSSGLRLSELRHLRVGDIDSHSDRMCLRVQQGKGAKDRYVPLAPDALQLLRQWWRQARLSSQPQQWLFPGQGETSQPVSDATPQKWYHAARAGAGITKQGGIHLLRHCYATHLLEAGVDLYTLSRWLGHNHVSTTSRYLHLARPTPPTAPGVIRARCSARCPRCRRCRFVVLSAGFGVVGVVLSAGFVGAGLIGPAFALAIARHPHRSRHARALSGRTEGQHGPHACRCAAALRAAILARA
jgi:hypothetical protein